MKLIDMIEFLDKFEKCVYAVLMALLAIVLVFAVGQLAWLFFTSVTKAPIFILDNADLLNVLGVFLLVLIAVELLDTMKVYFREKAIHVEIVVLLGIIAIARKVILLDPSTTNGIDMIGIGVVIISLAGAYYLIKKAGYTIGPGIQPPDNKM
jgi:uncharacterized membrane protein (DUF373 family)